jgi:uncharacterized lipoprotein YmbA
MTRRIAAIAAALALAGLAAGCASSPAHFFTLSPGATATSKTDAASSKLVIAVGPISIPAIVDMPQIVVSKGANQVAPDQFNLWASPLRNNIAQVVDANLVVLLGTPNVSSVLSSDADFRVAIDVQVFESSPGDAATLSAMWNVRRVKDGKTTIGRTSVREPISQKSYEALAAAHSRALGRLSADIADAIRALDHAGP